MIVKHIHFSSPCPTSFSFSSILAQFFPPHSLIPLPPLLPLFLNPFPSLPSSCSIVTLSTLLPSPLNFTSPLLYPSPITPPFLYPSSIPPLLLPFFSLPACHTTRCGVRGCHPQWNKGWYSQGPPPSRCVGVFGTGRAATLQLQAGQAGEEGTMYQV